MREMQFSMRKSAEPRRKKNMDEPVLCVLMCLLKSLVVKNEAWQCSHRNRRTPSCLCKCTFKWNFCLKKKFHTFKNLNSHCWKITQNVSFSKQKRFEFSRQKVPIATLFEILIFVQKFNFDFPRKLSIFLGEKLVKMLWFWTF